MKGILVYSIICCYSICLCASFGSNGVFSDLESKSINGKFLVKAIVVKGEKDRKKSDNIITLSNPKTGQQLWKHLQLKDEIPPKRLFVSDDGYTLMLDRSESFIVIDPNGKFRKVLNVFDLLSKKEIKVCCNVNSTAETFWDAFSFRGFITINERDYFYTRTYWGKIVAIDIKLAKQSSKKEVLSKIEEQVLNEAKCLIEGFSGGPMRICKRCGRLHLREDLKATVFVIDQYALKKGANIVKNVISRADDGEYPSIQDFLKRWHAAKKVLSIHKTSPSPKVEPTNDEAEKTE